MDNLLKISCLSDLEFEVVFRKENGEEMPVPEFPFRISYYTVPTRRKTAYRDGDGQLHGCTVTDGRLHVYLDAPRFDAGILRFCFAMDIPAEGFGDGIRTSTREWALPVQIINSRHCGAAFRRIRHTCLITDADLSQEFLSAEDGELILTDSGESIILNEDYGTGNHGKKISELEELSGTLEGFFISGSKEENGSLVSRKYSFTSNQWAAMLSGITQELVEKLKALPYSPLQSVKTIAGQNMTGEGDIQIVLDIKSDKRLGLRLNGVLVANQEFKTVNGAPVIGSGDIETYVKPSTGIPKSDLASGVQTSLEKADSAASGVASIEERIPTQASAQNQLADKAFTNSTIQTATANFRGSWDTFADVPTDINSYPLDYAGSKKPTVNDYMVVLDTKVDEWVEGQSYLTGDVVANGDYGLFRALEDMDRSIQPADEPGLWEPLPYSWYDSIGISGGTWRFKYSGDWDTLGIAGWLPEYKVNDKPLTAAQLAALNSNMTAELTSKLQGLPSKPVDTAAQVLTEQEKSQARANIGAGTSSFSGDYNDLTNKPDLSVAVQPFTNPVGPWRPDPCFWKADDGYFYIKGTGSANTVLRTRDFVHYENTGRTFLSESAVEWLNTNYGHYASDDAGFLLVPHHWAPQVLKIGDNWVLYMAIVERVGTKAAPTESTAHIVAFTSRTPYGNFTDPVTIVSDDEVYAAATSSTKWKNVIDPFVYCDPDDNKLYLIGGSSYAIRRVRLTDDGLALAAGTYAQHVAGQSINTNPNRETVYEGAYLYKHIHDGTTYWYLFVSAGHYDQRDYCLRVGRSTKASGVTSGTAVNYYGMTGVSMRNGGGTLILSTESDDSQFWGPGHIGGIFESADGRTFMLYHCHDGNGSADRKLFIQELFWDNAGWPYLGEGHPVASGEVPLDIITETTNILAPGNKEADVLNIEVGTTDPAIIAKVREFAAANKPVVAWDEEIPFYLSYCYADEDLVFTHYDVDAKWIYAYRVNDYSETPIAWSEDNFDLSVVKALSIRPVTMGVNVDFMELDSHAYDALRQADVIVDTASGLYYKKNPALSPHFIVHNFNYYIPGTDYLIHTVAGAWANSISYDFTRNDFVPDVDECDILLLVTYDNGERYGLIKIIV